jgi:hypothetical protein
VDVLCTFVHRDSPRSPLEKRPLKPRVKTLDRIAHDPPASHAGGAPGVGSAATRPLADLAQHSADGLVNQNPARYEGGAARHGTRPSGRQGRSRRACWRPRSAAQRHPVARRTEVGFVEKFMVDRRSSLSSSSPSETSVLPRAPADPHHLRCRLTNCSIARVKRRPSGPWRRSIPCAQPGTRMNRASRERRAARSCRGWRVPSVYPSSRDPI